MNSLCEIKVLRREDAPTRLLTRLLPSVQHSKINKSEANYFLDISAIIIKVRPLWRLADSI